MIRGRVVSFDRIKGYGFVAPDVGGEDVFIHVNDLHSDKSLLTQGSIVEFRLDEGERGPKASAVTVVQPGPLHAGPVHAVPAQMPVPAAAAVPPAPASAAPDAPRAEGSAAAADAEDELCDTLSAAEFEHEVSEALLRTEPELTGRQILEVRKRLLRIAQGHGWIDR